MAHLKSSKIPSKHLTLLVLFAGLLFYFSLFFAIKINLSNADIGRHLVNGLNFLYGDRSALLNTDFYSYTHPNFPHINHHYLSGVVFYVIYFYSGFVGLSYFYALLGGALTLMLFLYAYKKIGLVMALLTTTLFLPFFSFRTEVRPEIFTYIFFAIQALVLIEKKDNLKPKHYLLIFVTQALCINLHNYAVFTFVLTFGMFVEALIFKNQVHAKKLLVVFVVQFFGTIANPYGLSIFLVPLKPFFGMGLQIAENLPLTAHKKLLPLVIYSVLGLVGGIAGVMFNPTRKATGISILTIIFSCLSLAMYRLVMLYNIVFFIFIVNMLVLLFENRPIVLPNKKLLIVTLVLMFTMLAIPLNREFGVGLRSGVEKGGEFLVKNKLSGNIFNDFNAGGYAIFYLSMGQSIQNQGSKVFVHNVPESLPVDFMRDWHNSYLKGEFPLGSLEKYNFNYILVSTYKRVPVFLLSRIQDENWKLVYYDDYVAILVKNNEQNAPLIKKYEVSAETKEYLLRKGVNNYAICKAVKYKNIENVCVSCKNLCITPWGKEFYEVRE